MRIVTLLILFTALMSCATRNELQKSTLAVDDKLDVIPAYVNNPYPECSTKSELRRMADLSVERSKRVYLQSGNLCQRSK